MEHLESDSANQESRFSDDVSTLRFGRMKEAALGVAPFLCVPQEVLFRGLGGGLDALRHEVETNGTADSNGYNQGTIMMVMVPNSPPHVNQKLYLIRLHMFS